MLCAVLSHFGGATAAMGLQICGALQRVKIREILTQFPSKTQDISSASERDQCCHMLASVQYFKVIIFDLL